MNAKIIVISLLLFVSFLKGQNKSNNTPTYWGGFGIGVSVNNHSTFLNSAQYTLGLRNNNISYKFVAINNVESMFRKVFTPDPWKYPRESINTLSIQIGYTVNVKKYEVSDSRVGSKELNFTIYSGISQYKSIGRGYTLIGTGVNQVQYNTLENNGIGFPVEFEFDWRFNNYFGLTSSLFVELNSSQPFGGFQLNVIVGNF